MEYIWYNFCNFALKITIFMKNQFVLLIAILATLLSACNLVGESNFTPDIFLTRLPNNQNGDTIHAYVSDDGSFKLDTMTVGDTLSFYLTVTGYENHLTAFYIKQSADSVTRTVLPPKNSMDSIFSTNSDYKSGKFMMDGTMTTLFFPFKYVAMKPSKEAKLSFTVVSDAHFDNMSGSNTTTLTFKTPIIEKKIK